MLFFPHICSSMRFENTNKEKELVLGLIKDDEKAFTELYSLYYNRLIYFTMKFVKSEDIAKDIYQDIFTVVWQTRHFINTNASFSSYLYTITRNRILNLLRDNAQKRKIHDKILAQAIDSENYTEKEIIQEEYNEILEKAISKLTDRQREIFELSRFDDLSHKEIAERLNISVYTVQEHISAALKTIKEYLMKYGSSAGIIGLILFLVNKG